MFSINTNDSQIIPYKAHYGHIVSILISYGSFVFSVLNFSCFLIQLPQCIVIMVSNNIIYLGMISMVLRFWITALANWHVGVYELSDLVSVCRVMTKAVNIKPVASLLTTQNSWLFLRRWGCWLHHKVWFRILHHCCFSPTWGGEGGCDASNATN